MNRRRPLVGGNWKMNLSRAQVAAYAGGVLEKAAAGHLSDSVEVVLFPPPTLVAETAALLSGRWATGGQDLHVADRGAHTGDVSGPHLVDAGCQWVLCGHSERRKDHHETDELVGEKAAAAVRNGLIPLICLGETLEQRQSGRTFEVLERQLGAALATRPEPMALAYEPVWAIGTGETATPEMAQEAHGFIRETLADLVGEEVAAARRILYGGSAKPSNAKDLFAGPDIDGFLVGGASLDLEDFLAIIVACG